jgi:hypothetical protein
VWNFPGVSARLLPEIGGKANRPARISGGFAGFCFSIGAEAEQIHTLKARRHVSTVLFE